MGTSPIHRLKRVRNNLVALVACFIVSCTSAPKKQPKPVAAPMPKKPVIVQKSAAHDAVPTAPVKQRANMEFVAYNDDGDYMQLIAKKGNDSYAFINDSDTSRNLNRGDRITVSWRTGTIYIAGDGDTPAQADMLISVRKTGDGPVTNFRKTYGKPIKYTWTDDRDYSRSYLDKLYLQVEYYVAKTNNELLKLHVDNKNDLTYSIEQQERDGRQYVMLGIAATSEHNSSPFQWLYYDIERDQLYEYNLPEDKLVIFD
jgi:hypothetical protein